ncbi:hypothetical protein MPTK1_3g10210 [Marchantia polymorpha subsp. ruderalis]|uniref:Uncharacterized protein n=2 Tax=Marchantia polymorpha TaxID=3197 RepID=A0AAF6AZA7_MARPO|nr:hypothetical protein MARPO_0085s0006 [Marchantia polymorpha]BBN05091.1 hypothetical protein Mp_3g10210 [Marchantia polymorpha subsp. ruderalis]|eukprot:PTQ33782.1 hypothetical protein MARPO_0085s0006 [Marchantia polymorpha]
MGSLMAGWQTNRCDAEAALKRTTSSMTKAEVERFWRSKRNAIKRHLRFIEAQQDAEELDQRSSNSSGSYTDSTSTPSTPTASSLPNDLSSNTGRQAWWTRSSWAFLNEPPAQENKKNRYTPQFDVVEECGNARLVRRRNSMSTVL